MTTTVLVAFAALAVVAFAAYWIGLVEGHRKGWWEGKHHAERLARKQEAARIRRALGTWPHEGDG